MSDVEAIRTMKELTQALRQTNRMSFVTDADRAGTPMADRLASLERQYKEHSDMLSKVNRGMLNIFPSLDIFRDTVKKTTYAFEKSIMGQTDAYKEAATATYKYAKGTGDSAKKLEGIAKSMDGIQSATDDIMKSAKGRSEIEKQLADTTATNAKKVLAASKGWDNISGVITATTQDIRNTKRRITRLQARELDAEGKVRLREERKNLQALERSRREMKNIQKTLFDNLRDALRSGEFTNAIQNIRDPQLRAVMTKLMEMGKLNNKQLMDKLSELSGIVDGVSSGGSTASKEKKDRLLSMEEEYYRKTDEFRKSLIPALGMTLKKELGLVSERQMRGARQRGLRYSAAMMGMSESSALRLQDENRFVLTQMALSSGHTSAESFFRSGDFRQIQRHGRLLGLRGEQAAETMLGFADTLRRIGITPTADNLGGMSRFIKHGHQRYGITQDDMIRRFENMASDAMITGIIRGSDDLFESITRETDSRMKLARQLNQEVDIQEKRLRQMTDLATGDPAHAMSTAIHAMMAARVAGVDLSDGGANILMRGIMGDTTLSEIEGNRAAALYEDIIISSGERWSENVGSRFVLFPLMSGAGFDPRESLELLGRSRGSVPGVLDTPIPVEDLNDVVNRIIGSLEKLDGALGSSVGSIVSVVGAFANLALNMALIGAMRGGAPKWLGGLLAASKSGLGRVAGVGGRILNSPITRIGGPVASIAMGTIGHGMAISDLNRQRKYGEISEIEHKGKRDREMAAMAGGIAGGILGAVLGTFVPIPGGTVMGAMAGQFIGSWVGSKLAGGGVGSGALPSTEYERVAYAMLKSQSAEERKAVIAHERAVAAHSSGLRRRASGELSSEDFEQLEQNLQDASDELFSVRYRLREDASSAAGTNLLRALERGGSGRSIPIVDPRTRRLSVSEHTAEWTPSDINALHGYVASMAEADNLHTIGRKGLSQLYETLSKFGVDTDDRLTPQLEYIASLLVDVAESAQDIKLTNQTITRVNDARRLLELRNSDIRQQLRMEYEVVQAESAMEGVTE